MSTVDPIPRVSQWLADARDADPAWSEAVCLATVSADGKPSARMVLLKAFDARGFVFYTNLESRKGTDLLARPDAALCFHWPDLERQLRAEGPVALVSQEEADAYFASRPRGSQIGAWASAQSRPLQSREELLARVAECEQRFAGAPVPRPPHWSGFRLSPELIELWQGEPSRLHRREAYTRHAGGWSLKLLNP